MSPHRPSPGRGAVDMIVRISGEDQYRLDEEHVARLNELDTR